MEREEQAVNSRDRVVAEVKSMIYASPAGPVVINQSFLAELKKVSLFKREQRLKKGTRRKS
jgi:hypothetical protein